MITKEKENIERIIKVNHENNMEEEKKKFIKNSIDQVEDILSKYNCIYINKKPSKSYIHATIGYDFSLANQCSDIAFIFNLFRPNILFDKKDYFDEMEKRGYRNFIIDFTNFCIQFDVVYVCAGDIYVIIEQSENEEEKSDV